MAISFINAGAEAAAASDGITLNAPSSPQNDDIWIAVVHTSDQNSMSMDAAWTQIFQANGGGSTSRLGVWWFRYAGSTPTLTVTHTGGATIIGGIAVFRGCLASGSPVDTTGSGGAGTDDSIEIAGFSPSTRGTMLVVCDGAADDNNRSTLPTDFTLCFEDTAGGTQRSYHSTAGTPDGSVACHYRTWVTGATGDFVDTQAASDPWASVMFALKRATVIESLVVAITGAGTLGVNLGRQTQFSTAISASGTVTANLRKPKSFSTAINASGTLTANLGRTLRFGLTISTVTPDVAFGSFAKDDSNTDGATDVISLSFTPKAIIFWATVNTGTDEVTDRHINGCFGFSDGTNNRCIHYLSKDNVDPPAGSSWARNDCCIRLDDDDAGPSVAYGPCTFQTNQFTITWTMNNTVASIINYMAIGGDGITAEVNNFTKDSGTSPSSQSVSTTVNNVKRGNGFLILLDNAHLSFASKTAFGNHVSFGITDGIVQTSRTQTIRSLETPVEVGQAQRNDRLVLCVYSPNQTISYLGNFTKFTSSGFDIYWDPNAASSSNVICYLLVKGGNWEVGYDDVANTSDDEIQTYLTRVKPGGVFAYGVARTSDGVAREDSCVYISGSKTPASGNLISFTTNDNVAPSDHRVISNSQNLINIRDMSSLLCGGFLNRLNASDFEIAYSTTDANRYSFSYLIPAAKTGMTAILSENLKSLTASITASATVTAVFVGGVTENLVAAINASGTLTGNLGVLRPLTSNINGSGTLTANLSEITVNFARLTQQAVEIVYTADAETTTALVTAEYIEVIHSIFIYEQLIVAINASGTLTANLIRSVQFSAAINATGVITADLTEIPGGQVENLTTAIISSGLLTANLDIEKQLTTAITSSGLLTANLDIEKPLTTDIVSSGLLTATLNIEKPLTVAISSSGTMTADLSTTAAKQLTTAITSSGLLTANLDIEKQFSTDIVSSGQLTANLEINNIKLFNTDIVAAANLTAYLNYVIANFAADINSNAVVTARLIKDRSFIVNINSSGTFTANLYVWEGMFAHIVSNGTMTANLSKTSTQQLSVNINSTGNLTANLSRFATQQLSTAINSTGTLEAIFGLHQYLAADFTGFGVSTFIVNIDKIFTVNYSGTGNLTLNCKVNKGFRSSFTTTAVLFGRITKHVEPGWKACYAQDLNKLVVGELEQ